MTPEEVRAETGQRLKQRILDGLADVTETPRGHLGASIIGHHCDRWIWLSFRWAIKSEFDGRMRRLFRRGHLEEEQVVADLTKAGCKVFDKDPNTGRQWNIKDGHFGGSMDGLIKHGADDLDWSRPHILEIKTHSLKSFDNMEKNGVQKSKPQHYAQMQVYMLYTGIPNAVYFAVCKNDDRVYTEFVILDREYATGLVEKAQRLIASDRMPEPISTDPTWYQCKFCDAYEFCHGDRLIREVNCRTCAQSTAKRDGTWGCARWQADIPNETAQINGCDDHVMHPDMVPWPMEPVGDGLSVFYIIDGVKVRNGNGGFKSREILANIKAVVQTDMMEMVKGLFPQAEITA